MIQSQKPPFVVANNDESLLLSLNSQYSTYPNGSSITFELYKAMIDELHRRRQLKKARCFSTAYQELCLAINLQPNDRKIKMDSMFKKCKSKYCKAIQEALYCLQGDRSKIGKLPQAFITNINIKYNQKYFLDSLMSLYNEFGVVKSNSALFVANNERNVKITKLLNLTFIEGYAMYLHSDKFKEELKSFLEKNGLQITLMFYYSAHLFVDYIMYSKGAKEKTKSQRVSTPQVNEHSLSYDTSSSDMPSLGLSSKLLFKVKHNT